ncbi:hypothetical protein D7I44_12105 [Gryllotalpicola protaetiae]|uniref:Uncharacterized protein n=2 Tax=Gryllotalpicola protaetiae TaxID=2419771 RepID=A0A387BT10_9MICO|nr:hypothetical protein D7I44_12105 [Gryllotalpicola protaetiae]
MNDSSWSDRALRDFITRIRDLDFGMHLGEDERDGFIRQAEVRLVPEVRRRVLAEIGATIDAHGVASVAFETLEQETWGKRHTWLMVTTDPWAFLTDLVTDEVRGAYKASARSRADAKRLKGIAEASPRAELMPTPEAVEVGETGERDDVEEEDPVA